MHNEAECKIHGMDETGQCILNVIFVTHVYTCSCLLGLPFYRLLDGESTRLNRIFIVKGNMY